MEAKMHEQATLNAWKPDQSQEKQCDVASGSLGKFRLSPMLAPLPPPPLPPTPLSHLRV